MPYGRHQQRAFDSLSLSFGLFLSLPSVARQLVLLSIRTYPPLSALLTFPFPQRPLKFPFLNSSAIHHFSPSLSLPGLWLCRRPSFSRTACRQTFFLHPLFCLKIAAWIACQLSRWPPLFSLPPCLVSSLFLFSSCTAGIGDRIFQIPAICLGNLL